jgi:hypothetical protein
MEKAKNVVSKMSLAAKKAWETRRKNMQSNSSASLKKKKEKKREKREVKDSGELKAVEKKELKELNGDGLAEIAKETQKRLDRKRKMEDAKNGNSRTEVKAVEVGQIIKNAKVERFSGGFKVVERA